MCLKPQSNYTGSLLVTKEEKRRKKRKESRKKETTGNNEGRQKGMRWEGKTEEGRRKKE